MAQAPSAHPTLKDRDSFQSIPSQTNLGLRTTLDDVSDVNKMHNKLLSWSFSRKSYDSDRESYVDSLNSLSSSLKERLNLVGAHAHSGIIMPSPSHSARGGDAQSPKSFVSLSDEQLVHTPSAGGGGNNNGNNNNQPNLGNFKFKKQKSKDSDHKTPKHTKGLPSVTFSSTVSLFSESDKRKNSILFHEVHGVKANITSDTEDSKEREVRETKNKNKNKNKNNNNKKTNNKTNKNNNNNKGKGTGKGTKGKGKGKGGKGKATLKSSTMDNNNDSKKTGQDPKKRLKKVGAKTKNNKNKNNNNKNKDDEKTAPNNNNNKGTGKKGKKRKKNAIAQGYLAKLRNQG